MADRWPVHVLPYGDFGSGKSTFASTFPNPMLVLMWDAYGKETPYLRGPNWEPSPIQQGPFCPYRTVHSKKTGKMLKRIEYYHDTTWVQPEVVNRKAGKSIKDMSPDAYHRFLKRMAAYGDEEVAWATVVCDSVTAMEIASRRWDQFTLNPDAQDARQWYGASKDMLERMLLGRLAGLPCNVVVCAHIDDQPFENQGRGRRMPMAPGKLRASLPSQYGEVYRSWVDDRGEHWMQTKSDGLWACTTQLELPEQIFPHYSSLWAPQETA